MIKIIKITLLVALILGPVAVIFLLIADSAVRRYSASLVIDNSGDLPAANAGLVLGTSPTLASGAPNPYFTYRMEAAADLYHSGKIRRIVVSGDNSRNTYNEPQAMKDSLVGRGVPAEVIFLDYAGFRTLDSVVRMEEIFSQSRFIVISQRFHNERAVYLARHKGMEAWGYNARDVSARMGLKTQVREKFARVKMFLDLWTHKPPRFLGDKVDLGIE